MTRNVPEDRASGKLGYIPEFDGLRAIAILLVVGHHIYLKWPETLGSLAAISRYGWIGVEIFFVLSGYLITSILLKSEPGLPALRNFYTKRALRIWPLYYILLLVVCVQALRMHDHYPWKISLVFFQNYLTDWPTAGFIQTWSLCIEEHFYLVWPLLVFLAPRRVLPWILGLVVAGSPLLRWWAISDGVSSKLLYTSTQYRLDGIALGSLLALVDRQGLISRSGLAKLGAVVLPFASLCALLETQFHPAEFGQRSATLYTFLAFSSASIVCLILKPGHGLTRKALTIPPMRYVGKISYGLYMIHPFVFRGISRFEWHSSLSEVLAAVGFSIGLSAFSWHFVESRFIRLKTRRSQTVVASPNIFRRARKAVSPASAPAESFYKVG